MIKITPAAAEQIRRSQETSSLESLGLRIAVTLEDDGTFVYGMGFDEKRDTDTELFSEGVRILVSDASRDVLMGATLDYVEINPNEHRFIFSNPNDPSHSAAKRPGGHGRSDD